MMLPTNQTGIVYCTPELYLGPEGAELLKHIRPLRVEFIYTLRQFEIQAYSEHFDVLDEGEASPVYKGLFSLGDNRALLIEFERE